MSDQPDYLTREVSMVADPLLVAAELARRLGDGDYIVYEGADGFTFARAGLAEIVVDQGTVRVLSGQEETTEPWRGSPYPALHRALAGLPLSGWRAYGTADFELAYANDEFQPGQGTGKLLRLFVPELEVRLRDGTALVRAADPALVDAAAAVVAAAVPEPDPAAAVVPAGIEEEGADEYREAVASALQEIREGRLLKVILSRVVSVPDEIDLPATYVVGRRANTPARSFLLRLDGVEAAGFSPEIVAAVDAEGQVTAQPLAGTRARFGDRVLDAERRAELLTDGKEVFEHAISVHLVQEELKSVSEAGSTAVTEFMAVKERGSVQHLGSALRARLAPGRGPWDAFAALFPAVTASGIPKPAAYQCIRAHEAPRGLYSGAVMVVGADGTLDAALVLRSVFRVDGRTWLRAGAGIVAQSDPARELEETREKLRSVSRHLVSAAPDTAHHGTLDGIRAEVAALLELDPACLGDEDDLFSHGVTSLEVMTLASRWSTVEPVSYAELVERPSVVAWADLLDRRL